MARTVAEIAVLMLIVVNSATAQTTTNRVLVPISGAGPGAFGSFWTFELWAHNGGTSNIGVLPSRVTDLIILPGRSSRLEPFQPPPGLPPGQFLTIAGTDVGNVTFHLRVRDVSRASETWGTEIPVVPEAAFRAELVLLNVPVDEQFRSTLRIYGPPFHSHVRARVRIFNAIGGVLLSDEVVTLVGGGDAAGRDPAYLQVGLPTGVEGSPLRLMIEIRAVDETPLWAFVSVTHNVTQHVTTISPAVRR